MRTTIFDSKYTIMRFIPVLLVCLISFVAKAQDAVVEKTSKDSLLIIKKNSSKGFYNDYILFIPKGTLLKQKTFLLVEPNNTGVLNDSMEVHEKAAIRLASKSSVGNNISTELHIPLLVPVFPRTASQPLIYTHALDRDVMRSKAEQTRRLDLQLIQMIEDARTVLSAMNIQVAPKFFMSGFSASGTFTNRFSMMHPERIQALAIGGFNGELMLPQPKINGIRINYPIGTNDLKKITGRPFNIEAYRAVPQYIYMGKLDDNDAVQFDDAYDDGERNIINANKGNNVQDRYLRNQQLYKANNIQPTFISYDKVGHWTTSAVNLDVIRFFMKQVKEAN